MIDTTKITISHFQEELCILYDNKGCRVGVISNLIQFLDIRIKIAEQRLKGYYIIFKGEKIYINPNGSISDDRWDLFPLTHLKTEQLNKLMNHEKDIKEIHNVVDS